MLFCSRVLPWSRVLQGVSARARGGWAGGRAAARGGRAAGSQPLGYKCKQSAQEVPHDVRNNMINTSTPSTTAIIPGIYHCTNCQDGWFGPNCNQNWEEIEVQKEITNVILDIVKIIPLDLSNSNELEMAAYILYIINGVLET